MYAKVKLIIQSIFLVIVVARSVKSHHQKGHGFQPHFDLSPGKETIQENLITYYMYNITNPDEFEAGEKPELEEVGPFVYKETRRKFNVSRVSDSVMKYSVDSHWEFMEELSEGHEESEEINVINIPMMILANKLSAKRLPKAFNDILVEELTDNGESLVRRNEEIGNILYHGMNVSAYTEILSDVLQGRVPPEFSDGKFALYKGQNGSLEGTFTVSTKGPQLGDILTYNNLTKLAFWGGEYCNRIDGTDGYFFRPGVGQNSTLKIFYPQLCRSIHLSWAGVGQIEGINVTKFSFPEDLLEDPQVDERNKCFCSKPIVPSNDSMAGCLKRGFIDYASCKQESPLLISFPHFLYADEEYKNKVVGIEPDEEKDTSEFLIEPKTGTILSGRRKFQFNVKLRPLDNVDFFLNTSFAIIPVFITEREIVIPEERIKILKDDLKSLEQVYEDKDFEHDAHDHDHDHDESQGHTHSHKDVDFVDDNELTEGKPPLKVSLSSENDEDGANRQDKSLELNNGKIVQSSSLVVLFMLLIAMMMTRQS